MKHPGLTVSDLQSCLKVRVMGGADLLLLPGSDQSELALDLHHRREHSSPGAQQAETTDGRSDLKFPDKTAQ